MKEIYTHLAGTLVMSNEPFFEQYKKQMCVSAELINYSERIQKGCIVHTSIRWIRY